MNKGAKTAYSHVLNFMPYVLEISNYDLESLWKGTTPLPEHRKLLLWRTRRISNHKYFTVPSILSISETEDRSYGFPYPKEVIYATPQNYGYMVEKKKEWDLQEDEATPQWGNERQVNNP